MADFQISWSIEGETQLSRVLIGMGNDLKDYTKPMTKSANMLKQLFAGPVFDTRGSAIGEKWKPLSPVTIAQKARQGLPQPDAPLIGTGKMKKSFKALVSKDQAVISNTAPYFPYHQSNQPRHRLPRRVMMKIDEQRKEQIVKYFQGYIIDSLKGK